MQMLWLSLLSALECITVNTMQGRRHVGAGNESIYVIDLSVTAITMSAANATIGYTTNKQKKCLGAEVSY